MKRTFTISALFVLVVCLTNQVTKAQTTFKMGDLNSYTNAYVEPFGNAMVAGLGGGWAHTAKVHSAFGFDLTISATFVTIPDAASTVAGSEVSIPGFKPITGQIPTISAKSDVAAPVLSKTLTAGNGAVSADFDFNGFNGVGLAAAAMPAIQIGFGLPKGTEIIGRFIPNMSNLLNNALSVSPGNNMSVSKTGMWGIGVKHDIKQWIPVLDKVPFLQISGLFSYSRFYTGFSGGDFAITPELLDAVDNANTSWNDQEFKLNMSSFTGNLLVGANIPVFQPYIGVGFNTGSFESGFYGTYPVISLNETSGDFEAKTSEKDPIVVKTKKTSINFQAGARLKLGPIVFFGQATFQEYALYTGGIAVTIR
ncbi:MAG: hypothetical protein JEZ09_19640 [Salinivirgaceae bacterium]|nr:hypothetical protein [Salinivirgaceae bacterium]